MPTLTADYSATDANFWRAVITTDGGVKVAGFEVRRLPGLTKRAAIESLAVMLRSLRPHVDKDAIIQLLRSIEAEADRG